MLSDLAALRGYLRLSPTDNTQDPLLEQLLTVADRAVKLFCKRTLETSVQTEYREGNNYQDLTLYQRPIQCYLLTGTLTNGSATVTGLSSTSNLVVGMPALALSNLTYIPAGTTISAIPSSSSVTLSANSTVSGSYSIFFGLAVWLDSGGFGGLGNNSPFASTTQLQPGTDYYPVRDQSDGTSKCGILKRMGGGLSASLLGGWPGDYRRGSLTARLPPVWPKGYGNIQAVYAAGLGAGAANAASDLPTGTSLPAELTWAVNSIAAYLRAMTPAGVPASIETQAKQTADLLERDGGKSSGLGDVVNALRFYREVVL